MRSVLLLTLGAALSGFAPAAADASTVSVEGGTLRVLAAPGERNAINVGAPDYSTRTYPVSDGGAELTPGAGCTRDPGSSAISCAGAGVTSVDVDAGDMDDRVTVNTPLPTTVRGGPGADGLSFAPSGGFGPTPGATLDGGDGNDSLLGGPGNDQLVGGNGNDYEFCGAGTDSVRAEVLDTLDYSCEQVDYGPSGKVGRLLSMRGGGRFVPVPGESWARVDRRILPDVLYMIRKYKVRVGDGLASAGHKAHGEHPLGLAVDLYPGPGGSWSQVAKLARWAEPRQNHPRWPFRWVGWNGDVGHGDPQHCRPRRGCPPHLHLSWTHAPGRPFRPVRSVWVFAVR